MATLIPLNDLKRVKAPKRSVSPLGIFFAESVIFSNLLTLTVSTRSPQYLFSEIAEILTEQRNSFRNRAPKIDIKLGTGEIIDICAQSARKDL